MTNSPNAGTFVTLSQGSFKTGSVWINGSRQVRTLYKGVLERASLAAINDGDKPLGNRINPEPNATLYDPPIILGAFGHNHEVTPEGGLIIKDTVQLIDGKRRILSGCYLGAIIIFDIDEYFARTLFFEGNSGPLLAAVDSDFEGA